MAILGSPWGHSRANSSISKSILHQPQRYNDLALWRVINFCKESLSVFSLWAKVSYKIRAHRLTRACQIDSIGPFSKAASIWCNVGIIILLKEIAVTSNLRNWGHYRMNNHQYETPYYAFTRYSLPLDFQKIIHNFLKS